MNEPRAATQRALPVACTLGPDDGPARRQRWLRLHEVATPRVLLRDGELEVRYRPGPEVLRELQQLVVDERVCCSFVTWTVTEEGAQPILRVTAPAGSPEDIEPIASMFAGAPSSQ